MVGRIILRRNEGYNYKELIEVGLGNKIESLYPHLQHCIFHSLKPAILLNDNYLIDRIIGCNRSMLMECPFGYNSLLLVLPLGAIAHLTVTKLIKAGAHINSALGYKNENWGERKYEKDLNDIPLHATPLYIAAMHTKYLPTVCFLIRNGAICYPAPTEKGQSLINKAHSIQAACLQFYMGAIFCKNCILNELEIPRDISNYIIQVWKEI